MLKAVLRRERYERFAVVSLFARLLGGGLGVSPEAITGMLQGYAEELLQTRYTPTATAAARGKKRAEAQKKKADAQLLKKVEQLTVEDKDLPPVPKGGRRRR